MKYFLNVIYIIALIIISPLILYRIIAHNRYKKGLQNRLGKIDNENNNSALLTLVPIMEDTVRKTMDTMMVLNTMESVQTTVELNKDFNMVDDQKDGELVVKMGESKIISKKTVTASTSIARILPYDYDFENDQQQVARESAETTRQNAETPAGLDDPANQ